MVIPAAIRERARFSPGSELEITEDELGIRIQRVAAGPRLVKVGGRLVARPSVANPADFMALWDALAKIAGCTTPLHRCSTYESKEAGRRLNAMLSMGQSRPWPDALEALTGTRQMDATAILDYFAPLSKWLDNQIAGKPIGW